MNKVAFWLFWPVCPIAQNPLPKNLSFFSCFLGGFLPTRIFRLRTILLSNRVLPLRDRWIGNDLEMSGVLWGTLFWITKERSLLSLAKVQICERKWAFLRDFLLKKFCRNWNTTMKEKEVFRFYSRCERLRLISCFHFCSHQSVTGSPLIVSSGRFFSSLAMRISQPSSVNSLLYSPE